MSSTFLRKHKEVLSIILLAIVFFWVYLYLYKNNNNPNLSIYGKQPELLILNQPDEMANFFFIRNFVLNNEFSFLEPLSDKALSQIHPRSMTVVNDKLVPIGFPGIIVVIGIIVKILIKLFGSGLFNFFAISFTPVVAVLTPLIFYSFLRRIFNKQIAWLASILLFALPSWWYYASRPFQHNTFFVFLLICFLYFGALCIEKKHLAIKNILALLSGLSCGLAIYIRPSEAVWLIILTMLIFFWLRSSFFWRQFLSFVLGLLITAILFFATQNIFYGSFLGSGYVRPGVSGEAGSVLSGPQGIPFFMAIFLPFGFHPLVILKNIYGYFVYLFNIWSLAGFLGVVLLWWHFIKQKIPNQKYPLNIRYLILFLLCAVFLMIFYGSWLFYDNLLFKSAIGSSYVRYFLPIYVFTLPFIAWFLIRMWYISKLQKVIAIIFILVLSGSSYWEVFLRLEGLSQIKKTVIQYQEYREKISSLVEDNAIIVTHYGDKYLFPKYRVIMGWEYGEQIKAIENLVPNYPVYVYDLKLNQEQETNLNTKLNLIFLKLGPVIASWDNLEIRKIVPFKS